MSKHTAKYSLLPEFQYPQSGAKILHWGYPLEITCGAIDSSTIHGNLLDVQANTSKGLWDLHAISKSQVSEDELREFLEGLQRRHRAAPLHWNTRSPSIVIRADVATTSVAIEPSAPIEDRVADDEETLDDWRSSPSELLAKLQDPSISRDELFDAVLFAEIAKFDESRTQELLTRLFAFVNEYRLSQDEDVMTVVGAAVRKLAMNLQDPQIEQYADLFLPTSTDTLPCEIELELAKAIVWRLVAAPASLSRQCPKLVSRLTELASDYLKPRLILQKNYASVAIQAALGVLLLNGHHAGSILQSVKNLGIGWFTHLFQRRLERLRRQLMESADATSTAIATNLGRFESELQGASDQGDTTACRRGD